MKMFYDLLRTIHFKMCLNSKARIKVKGFARKGRGTNIFNPTRGEYGRNFYIGRYSTIECDTLIGNNVIIGNQVALVASNDHGYDQVDIPMREINKSRSKEPVTDMITIEDDVWLGHVSIIVGKVHIAKGCVIAAGAVLTKSTEQYGIYAGVPAKKIGSRRDQ